MGMSIFENNYNYCRFLKGKASVVNSANLPSFTCEFGDFVVVLDNHRIVTLFLRSVRASGSPVRVHGVNHT